ncbi:transcription factor IIIA [Elysia marginata]|uniref:Transcription factor IIIA n=1 Tax=Elysia marginata TaxID=1093978 RepID=A0AAV4HKQ7_9GAST|nr:transcription factor IIIA [Elysia marginata]
MVAAFSQPDMSNRENTLIVSEKRSKVKKKGRFLHQKRKITFEECQNAYKNKADQTELVNCVRPKRKCVKPIETIDISTTITIMSRKIKDKIINGEQALDFHPIVESYASESDDDYTPPSYKSVGNNTNQSQYKVKSKGVCKTKRKSQRSDVKTSWRTDEMNSINDLQYRGQLKSKSTVQELETELQSDGCVKSAAPTIIKPVMIQCIENDCWEKYPSWNLMAHHLKSFHYGGILPDKGEGWLKLSMLTENRNVKLEAYAHKCGQDGCDLAFTSERSLKEHNLHHSNGLTHICGFPDCPKAFKLSQSLRMHLQTHRLSLKSTLLKKINKPEKHISAKAQKKHPRKKSVHTENEHAKGENGISLEESTRSSNEELKCELCGKCFAKEINLLRHRRRMHGGMTE